MSTLRAQVIAHGSCDTQAVSDAPEHSYHGPFGVFILLSFSSERPSFFLPEGWQRRAPGTIRNAPAVAATITAFFTRR
jgi:hypothetical protein